MFRVNIVLSVKGKAPLETGPTEYQALGQTSFILKWSNVIFYYKAVLLLFMVYATNLRSIPKPCDNLETPANQIALPNSNQNFGDLSDLHFFFFF